MSIFSFYILFTKLMQQQKIISQGRKVRSSFWNSPNLREASTKLEAKSAYRAIVDDALVAQEQHGKLTDPIDQHDWMAQQPGAQPGRDRRPSRRRPRLPRDGRFDRAVHRSVRTVVGIYRALIRIGASGQASIDAVAGPVGEALIMTALGLVVAVPAVLAYNWLVRRNKSIMEDLAAFTNDLHGYLMSDGAVKPRMAARRRGARPGRGATAAAASRFARPRRRRRRSNREGGPAVRPGPPRMN